LEERDERKLYEKYVESGADSLSLDEVRKVLGWQDSNPAEALRIRTRHEQARRDAADRDEALAAWKASGRDEKDFDRRYGELRAEADATALREMTEGARNQWRRTFYRSF
jgi:hypothetical protein